MMASPQRVQAAARCREFIRSSRLTPWVVCLLAMEACAAALGTAWRGTGTDAWVHVILGAVSLIVALAAGYRFRLMSARTNEYPFWITWALANPWYRALSRGIGDMGMGAIVTGSVLVVLAISLLRRRDPRDMAFLRRRHR